MFHSLEMRVDGMRLPLCRTCFLSLIAFFILVPGKLSRRAPSFIDSENFVIDDGRAMPRLYLPNLSCINRPRKEEPHLAVPRMRKSKSTCKIAGNEFHSECGADVTARVRHS